MFKSSSWCAAALFLTMFIAIIGFSPVFIFGEGDLRTASIEAGGGDGLKQVAFLLLLVFSVYAAWCKGGIRALTSIPIWLALVLGWCILSVTWAVEPLISARRTMFCIISALTTIYLVKCMNVEKIINCLLIVCVVVLGLDWIALAISPMAVHQSGGAEPGLIGLWRGAQSHKNEAGALCAIAIILFIDQTFRNRSFIVAPALALAAVGFLLGTESKTSLGFVGIACAVGLASQLSWRSKAIRHTILCLSIAIILVLINFYGRELDDVVQLLDDPGSLTGRTQIWSIVISYIGDNPLLGAGYGSFWAIGESSPVFTYATGWVAERIDHAHNGYLNLSAQIGLIGLAFALIAVIVVPFKALFSSPEFGKERFVLTSLLAFIVLRDFFEDSLVDRANPAWIVAMIVITSVSKTTIFDLFITFSLGYRRAFVVEYADKLQADERQLHLIPWRSRDDF